MSVVIAIELILVALSGSYLLYPHSQCERGCTSRHQYARSGNEGMLVGAGLSLIATLIAAVAS